MQPFESEYYTVSEAASKLRVSGQTIRRWIDKGLLEGFRLAGKEYRIPIDKFNEFVANARAESSKGAA